jgi:hypothetical protein
MESVRLLDLGGVSAVEFVSECVREIGVRPFDVVCDCDCDCPAGAKRLLAEGQFFNVGLGRCEAPLAAAFSFSRASASVKLARRGEFGRGECRPAEKLSITGDGELRPE